MSTRTKSYAISPALRARRIISPTRLAELLDLSVATLARMVHRGELPAPLRLSPSRTGWPEDEIIQWLDARERARPDSTDEARELVPPAGRTAAVPVPAPTRRPLVVSG